MCTQSTCAHHIDDPFLFSISSQTCRLRCCQTSVSLWPQSARCCILPSPDKKQKHTFLHHICCHHMHFPCFQAAEASVEICSRGQQHGQRKAGSALLYLSMENQATVHMGTHSVNIHLRPCCAPQPSAVRCPCPEPVSAIKPGMREGMVWVVRLPAGWLVRLHLTALDFPSAVPLLIQFLLTHAALYEYPWSRRLRAHCQLRVQTTDS